MRSVDLEKLKGLLLDTDPQAISEPNSLKYLGPFLQMLPMSK